MKKLYCLFYCVTILFSVCIVSCREEDCAEENRILTASESLQEFHKLSNEAKEWWCPEEQDDLMNVISTFLRLTRRDSIQFAPVRNILSHLPIAISGKGGPLNFPNVRSPYVLDISMFYCDFRYDEQTGKWELSRQTDALSFRFDCEGKEAIICLVGFGNGGTFDSDSVASKIPLPIRLPKKVAITVTLDHHVLANASLYFKAKQLCPPEGSVLLQAKSGSCAATSRLILNPDFISSDESLSVKGHPLIFSSFSIEGQQLTTLPSSQFDLSRIQTISNEIVLLDQVYLRLRCKATGDLLKVLSPLLVNGNIMLQRMSEAEAIKLATLLNRHLSGELCFGKHSSPSMTVTAEPLLQSSENGVPVWTIQPLLHFMDGQTMSLEEFFAQNMEFRRLVMEKVFLVFSQL